MTMRHYENDTGLFCHVMEKTVNYSCMSYGVMRFDTRSLLLNLRISGMKTENIDLKCMCSGTTLNPRYFPYRTGGVLSPILFHIYIDSLLQKLRD